MSLITLMKIQGKYCLLYQNWLHFRAIYGSDDQDLTKDLTKESNSRVTVSAKQTDEHFTRSPIHSLVQLGILPFNCQVPLQSF